MTRPAGLGLDQPGSPWAVPEDAGAGGGGFDPPGGPPMPPRRPPGSRPSHPARQAVDPAPLRLALLALAGGVALDIGVRGGIGNVVVVVGIAFLVLALVTDRRLRNRQAQGLALAALVPAGFLAVWTSPWLQLSNAGAVVVLLTGAVVHARSGSVLDTSPLRLARRIGSAADRAIWSPSVLRPLVPRFETGSMDRALRVIQALLIALPVLGIVVLLLASADAVFAGLIFPDVDAGPTVGHLVLAGLCGLVLLAAVAAALGDSDEQVPRGSFGQLEVVTMLSLAVGVLALFVISQLVALTEAGDRLVESSDLTPAEYARSGFFQLCWATALLVGFVGVVRFLAAGGVWERTAVRVLGALVPTLALGLVAVSLRRMALYDQAFGLTMLRLWVLGAAVWMGLVLMMLAARNLGLWAHRRWVVGGAGLAALAVVLVANLVNPEAFVVRHNVERAEDGAELDVPYLADLSDDALPALVGATNQMSVSSAEMVQELVCTDNYRGFDRPGDGRTPGDRTGVAALNLAARNASHARSDLCAS